MITPGVASLFLFFLRFYRHDPTEGSHSNPGLLTTSPSSFIFHPKCPPSIQQTALNRRRSSNRTTESTSSRGSSSHNSIHSSAQHLPPHAEEEVSSDDEFNYFHGRRYHKTSSLYMLPNDSEEVDRYISNKHNTTNKQTHQQEKPPLQPLKPTPRPLPHSLQVTPQSLPRSHFLPLATSSPCLLLPPRFPPTSPTRSMGCQRGEMRQRVQLPASSLSCFFMPSPTPASSCPLFLPFPASDQRCFVCWE